MNVAYVSIGTNMGDRAGYLKQAVDYLRTMNEVESVGMSSIYETSPVGVTDQADFLNVVVRITTSLSPEELLVACQKIEQQLGRVRTIRWGPRTADLDILLYNNDTIETETLIVPHPRMRERAFVLIPLLELSSELVDPVTGRGYEEESAIRDGGVVLWEPTDDDE